MRKIDLENTKLLLFEIRESLDTFEERVPKVPLDLFEKMDPIIRDNFFAQIAGFPDLYEKLRDCAMHLSLLIEIEEGRLP